MRAVNAKCITAEETLKGVDGTLSCDTFMTNDLNGAWEKIIEKGWSWNILPWQVERAIPELPSLAQSALSADHATYSMASELEVA